MADGIRKVEILLHPNGKSPFFYVRYWIPRPGKKGWQEKWKSTRTTVRREAEAFRRKIERELGDGKRLSIEMPWTEFVEEFIRAHSPRKPRTTIMAYRMCLNAFTKTANPKNLGAVDVAMLEDFANARLDDKIAAATVNKDLRHLRAALRWAERREYISKSPNFKGVFVREEERKPVIIPVEDFLAMVAALRDPEIVLQRRPADWWRIFLYASYYLGLRRGELLGLTWARVSLEAGEVHVVATTSKGRKERVVPLAAEMVMLLAEWRDSQHPIRLNGEVLPWPYDSYRPLYEDWHAIQTKAGIPEGQHYVPKNCRSTCASDLIARQVPTVVVKDWLGHASVTTTERFYINTKPALRSAADKQQIRLDLPEKTA